MTDLVLAERSDVEMHQSGLVDIHVRLIRAAFFHSSRINRLLPVSLWR
jgi:hypothetical protein